MIIKINGSKYAADKLTFADWAKMTGSRSKSEYEKATGNTLPADKPKPEKVEVKQKKEEEGGK